ncbi:MAG: diphosphomevalonate decarboxylase [Phycisphaerae bacterium]|nr:diphosphomevalonate decarboxylase [Phycisphaerae bacterium]
MMPQSESHPITSATACAGPSLALTKYWGKAKHGINKPATPSLGLTLTPLQSHATVSLAADGHEVTVNGVVQPLDRFAPFLKAAAKLFDRPVYFKALCTNSFPTSAGLASSSSGFAALALAMSQLAGRDLSHTNLSVLARIGSGSAARAVWGGFVEWPAGAAHARPLYDESYWPELRVIVCLVHPGCKAVSSRNAMTQARDTSPYYDAWVKESACMHHGALTALASQDLEQLGDIARHSYLRMFGTMLAMSPPLVYWVPASVQLIHLAQGLRKQGIGVWETMDAGPQVKLLCAAQDVDAILCRLNEALPELTPLVAQVGAGPCLIPSTTV